MCNTNYYLRCHTYFYLSWLSAVVITTKLEATVSGLRRSLCYTPSVFLHNRKAHSIPWDEELQLLLFPCIYTRKLSNIKLEDIELIYKCFYCWNNIILYFLLRAQLHSENTKELNAQISPLMKMTCSTLCRADCNSPDRTTN